MIGYAVLGGFVLDAVFGDPAWLPHPVVYMGKAISALEKGLRARLPKTPEGELWGGRILAFCLPVGTFAITSLVCMGAAALHPLLGLAVQMFWCGQALAAKGLVQESMNVYRELTKPDLPAARIAVSRIVGRDTQALTAEGVTKAAVETVAENASDGVIAPLFYMLLGGAPLALTYKAINTMDSMVGYKNERYLRFGRAAAKLDDIAIIDLGKAGSTAAHSGRVAACGSAVTAAVAAAVVAAVIPAGIAEIHIVGHDLSTAALVAVPVLPIADLKPSFDHGHTALVEILCNKFSGGAPGDHIDEIRLLLAGLGLIIAVHSQGKAGDGRTGLRSTQLGIAGQTTHDKDLVQHIRLPYSPLQTIMERITPSVMPRIRSSSWGNSGALVKLIST